MPTTPSQYREVAQRIRDRILRDRVYLPGAQLPKEFELAAELGVDRATVNRALRVLAAEGLVYVHRGKGTFVSTLLTPIHRNAAARYRPENRTEGGGRGAFDVEIRRLGLEPKSELTVSRVPAPEVVAKVFGVEPGTEVVARARRMFAGEAPVQIATSYIPVDIAAGTALEEQDSGPGGIVSRFAELGYAQVRMSERLSVRPPADEEANFLKMTPDQRVYEVVHVGWTAEGRPVEVCVHIMPTHLWELEYDWEVPVG